MSREKTTSFEEKGAIKKPTKIKVNPSVGFQKGVDCNPWIAKMG